MVILGDSSLSRWLGPMLTLRLNKVVDPEPAGVFFITQDRTRSRLRRVLAPSSQLVSADEVLKPFQLTLVSSLVGQFRNPFVHCALPP